MSFILDALKKSENDRQRQASPALFEVKVAQPRRKFPVWAAALAVLLGVNMIALAWVLGESEAPSSEIEKKVKEIVVTREMIERKAPVFEVMTRTEEAA